MVLPVVDHTICFEWFDLFPIGNQTKLEWITMDWVQSHCVAWFHALYEFHTCVTDSLIEACQSTLSSTDRDLGICAIFILFAVLACPLIAARYVRNVDDAAKCVLDSAIKFTEKVGGVIGDLVKSHPID